jgi:hypothetical protein
MKTFILALSFLALTANAAEPKSKSAPATKKPAPLVPKPAPAPEPTTWEKVKETSSEAVEKTFEKVGEAQQAISTPRQSRAERKWVINGNYSYFDLLIPGKWGGTVGYVKDASNTYELEYMRGSWGLGWLGVDIGKVTEQRIAAVWRTFGERGTFNYQMGLNYNIFNVEIGNTLLSKITGDRTRYEVMNLETLGVSWGIGNRWQTRGGFLWSFDWFQLHVPVVTTKQNTAFVEATPNQEDRDDAKTAVRWIRHFPRIAALKFQIGFSF